MYRNFYKGMALMLFVIFTSSFQDTYISRHFTIEKLAPGVWAAINNDNYGHAICNAGIIDLGDRTLIFDPFMNIDAAKDLKKIAKQLTNKEASIVINSHYHNDHIRGNQVFLPATIISSEWTRNRIAISEPEELAWEKKNAPALAAENRNMLSKATGAEKSELALWIGYYEAMVTNGPLVKTTLPSLTFNDSLRIYGTGRNVLLVEYRNGHSGSDVILKTTDGIAFMGDLLFEKRHPYLGDGVPASWINNLNEIYADNTLIHFVPGHGNVCTRNELHTMAGYINDVLGIVDEGRSHNVADSIIKKTAIPVKYENWMYSRFYKYNLSFLTRQKKSP